MLENIVNATKMLRITVLASAVLAASFLGCKRKESAPLPQNTQTTLTYEYFPLAVDNTWTYVRTVPQHDKVAAFAEVVFKDPLTNKETINFAIARAEGLPEVSEETYSITRHDGKTWHATVQGTNPRDGRYAQARSILWGSRREGLLETINDGTTLYRQWTAVLQPYLMLSSHHHMHWAIGSKQSDEKITVPAGTFEKCLINDTFINSKNPHEAIFQNTPAVFMENRMCFSRRTWYAKNVGLIKEEQNDKEGNPTYRLELKTYHIK